MLLMQAADDFVSPLILSLLDVDAGEGFGEYTAVFLFAILAGIGLKFGSKFWFVIFVLLDLGSLKPPSSIKSSMRLMVREVSSGSCWSSVSMR